MKNKNCIAIALILFLLVAFPVYAQLHLEEKPGGGLHIFSEPGVNPYQNSEPADNTPQQRFYSAPDVEPPKKYRKKRPTSSQKNYQKRPRHTPRNNKTVDLIKSDCAVQWGGNYEMQNFCINEQIKSANAAAKLFSSYSKNSEEYRIIGRCSSKWEKANGGYDYNMVLYCAKNQIEAYHNLQR